MTEYGDVPWDTLLEDDEIEDPRDLDLESEISDYNLEEGAYRVARYSQWAKNIGVRKHFWKKELRSTEGFYEEIEEMLENWREELNFTEQEKSDIIETSQRG